MDDEIEVTPRVLAGAYFTEARVFLQEKLNEAVMTGHLAPEAASDILLTFAKHFDSLLHIAKRGPHPSDLANAAYSILTITMAAFTAGSRDPNYLDWVKRAEGSRRAARARESKAKTSASEQLNKAISALAEKHKRPNEDLNKRSDRTLVSARIKPSLDDRVKELLQEGFKNTKTLNVEAIEKRLLRLMAVKPSDG